MRRRRDPDAAMIPAGDPRGSPTVQFDREAGRFYHLDRARRRVYHEVPAGFHLNGRGVLRPLTKKEQAHG